jgi:hypothetical protein
LGGERIAEWPLTFQIPDNATTARLRNLPLQAIRLWFSGDMHARDAGALAQLCNFLHRVIPTAELEARVAMLEEQLAQKEIEAPSDRGRDGRSFARRIGNHSELSLHDGTRQVGDRADILRITRRVFNGC